MNYKLIYENLINRAKDRKLDIYTESHHIIPKCMNGDNSVENLVDLTPEEHYLAHQLLVKIYPSEYGLIKAAVMMCMNTGGNRPTNKLYGWLRRKHSESTSGENNVNFGKPRPNEVKEKISASNLGKSRNKGIKKGPMKAETKKKLSDSLVGIEAPHMVGDKNPMHRPGIKEKALATRKGKLRVQKIDMIIFRFQHIKTNEIYEGTRQQFRAYAKLTPVDVYALVSGAQKTSKKWRILINTD
jgi:hypothetical protein